MSQQPIEDMQSNKPEAVAEAPGAPHEAERKEGMSMLMKVTLAVVLLSSLIITISCVMRANQLRRESEELEAELNDYKDKVKELVYYINKEVDEGYIVDYAREHFDMFFPDEDVYYNDVNE